MSGEVHAGDFLMVGFSGTYLTRNLREFFEEIKPKGVILFKRNIENENQLKRLISDLREILGEPIIAIDEEGGDVSRIDFIVPTPSHMGLAATRDPSSAYRIARIIGRELKRLGINSDLAPVLDVNINPDNPIIGNRSFGEDPDEVALYGENYIKGLLESGVIATAKHFPGHGDTSTDSHYDLPIIPHNYERLVKVEIKPFQRAIRCGCPMIMVGHLYVPALDPEKIPASLSSRVINGFLRETLGFEGVVITDDLEMKAVSSQFEVRKAAVKALSSGADIVLICHTREYQEEAYEAIEEALKDPSFRKEALLKKERIEKNLGVFLKTSVKEKDLDREHYFEEALKIAKSAVTVVKWNNLPKEDFKKCIVFYPNKIKERVSYFVYKLSEKKKDLEIIAVPYCGSKAEKYFELTKIIEQKKTICIVFTWKADRDPCQKEFVEKIVKCENTIIVSTSTPYDIRSFLEAERYIALYAASPIMMDALIDLITSSEKTRGKLPVTIPNVAQKGQGLEVVIKIL